MLCKRVWDAIAETVKRKQIHSVEGFKEYFGDPLYYALLEAFGTWNRFKEVYGLERKYAVYTQEDIERLLDDFIAQHPELRNLDIDWKWVDKTLGLPSARILQRYYGIEDLRKRLGTQQHIHRNTKWTEQKILECLKSVTHKIKRVPTIIEFEECWFQSNL